MATGVGTTAAGGVGVGSLFPPPDPNNVFPIYHKKGISKIVQCKSYEGITHLVCPLLT